MKKITAIIIASFIAAGIAAQDSKTTAPDIQKKKVQAGEIKNQGKRALLDGRTFKISFTEKKGEQSRAAGKAPIDARKGVQNSGKSSMQGEKPVYSMFDANSKVLIVFDEGNLKSSIFVSNGCPYHVNANANGVFGFSARCKLNSGNTTKENASSVVEPANDTKLEIEAENKAIADPDHTGVTPMPDNMPKKKADDPAYTNKQLIPPPAGNVAPPPAAQAEGDWQAESKPVSPPALIATINGVVSGNTIEGTLSWVDASGNSVNYSFIGNTATKKDMTQDEEMGMK